MTTSKIIRGEADLAGQRASRLDVAALGHEMLAKRGILDPTFEELSEVYIAAAESVGETFTTSENQDVKSAVLHLHAESLLGAEGKTDYTEAEYLAAVERAETTLGLRAGSGLR